MNKVEPVKLIAHLKSLPSPLHLAAGVLDQKNSLGFVDTDSGVLIVDPTESTCGRFNVDPKQAYGVDPHQVQALAVVNEVVHKAVDEALNAMAFEVQTLLGVTDGGFAAAYFSDGELEQTMRESLAKYLIAELANVGDPES